MTGIADATISGKAIRSRADFPCPGGEGGSLVVTFRREDGLLTVENGFERSMVLEGKDTGDLKTVKPWTS